VLRAAGVWVVDERGVTRLRGATLAVHAGELLGVVGIEGAGQRELLRVLAGRLPPTSGTLELPAEVGFVPEDRLHDGIIPSASLTENVALRGAGRRRGRVGWRRWTEETRRVLGAFDVRAAGPDAPARTLSGGNQQKLVLARELRGGVAALVAENPSRGLDIRATAEVRERLRRARDQGAAVVVYSSDVDEVLALADRVVVMHAGALHELPVDRDRVARAMVGVDTVGVE
jgi:simple sugar transport system ATP-binding protein